ncbi:zinc finger protein 658B-like [Megalops cyprinoides]|uniref:zinc finger protein 658B-like n=1 Tax=Megalops cyprinoides TaxID=118141 RepID=UPI001864A31A|nr:zinc finger protein 658B-like [Megalops cyprinoides]
MNSVSFQTQLASIMEVLANAAVAEICELVDDGYAVLHLEISRRQKENEALKRKLQMMELRISRQGVEKARVQVRNELKGSVHEKPPFPAEDSVSKQLDSSQWRDGGPAAEREEEASVKSDESAEVEGVRPESVPIKIEKLEEDLENSDLQGGLKIREEKAVESSTGDGERAPVVDTQTTPAIDTDELNEQHSTSHSVWEDSGLDTVFKAEPENETANQTLQQRGSELGMGNRNSQGHDHAIYERTLQLDTFYTRGVTGKETEDPTCSYAATTDSGSFRGHGELPPVFSAEKRKMASVWNKEMISGAVPAQRRHYRGDRRREQLPLENVVFPSETHVSLQSNVGSKSSAADANRWGPCDDSFTKSKSVKPPYRVGTRRKLFICTYCGKSLACLKNLKTHLRVHTGEKPFSCMQCGKRFADSSNLKRHQSVHTGERKYGCTHCGKRFAQSGSLKVHQSVHTGQRQYSCTQCGKTFISSSHLKRHVSVHIGENF